MWLVFLVLAVLGVCVLLFHIMLELNALDALVKELSEAMRKHYGIE